MVILLVSFSPIAGRKPTVLILGSMPSQISLREQQYYGNRQNVFWWIMSELLSISIELSYSDRVRLLAQSNIALWDVLLNCERPGSLDSSIVRSSEQPNDISGFLEQYPSIALIAFNGGAAKTIFKRHCSDCLKHIDHIQLPSTSPAYASMRKHQKLAVWRTALQPFL